MGGFTQMFIGAALAVALASPAFAADALIDFDPGSAPVRFAVDALEGALRARDFTVIRRGDAASSQRPFEGGVLIRFQAANQPFGAEFPAMQTDGFAIAVFNAEGHRVFQVFSTSPGGAMYGGLELAEQIRARGVDGVVPIERNPYLPIRGVKFNLPLDLRTPSYSDMSDSAQGNIATVWDFDFWREYLDALARDRYNALTLWNLHPFPSMVKVPDYEDIALDDVWRSTIRFDEDYSTRTVDIVTPAMLARHEVVKKLTIDEKIAHWQRVMQYARDRNIDVYLITWNIYTYGVDGKYGIDDSLDNPRTRDYFRASVREMFHTYPLLRGIGLTVGENMGEISGAGAFQRKEDWAFATYGQGVMDAARAEPSRPIRMIHRQHEARAPDIAATFAPLIELPNVEFLFSFKYAQAHALSSTVQPYHRDFVASLGKHRTLWTIRNDDALMLRWAAPDFVREFIGNIPREPSEGLYLGSDMWVWGREFLELAPTAPRRLEIDKHWLHWLLWGRLAYEPSLDSRHIAAIVAARFAGADGAALLDAWQNASMVYPLTTGFHWADFDFQWYIEGCRSRPGPARTASGFHSVDSFITQPVHPSTDNIPIPRFVAASLAGEPLAGTTPPEVAARIDARADAALGALPALGRARPRTNAEEYAATLGDIRLMAELGKYYAAKIRGATLLATFRVTGNEARRREAIDELERALDWWRRYTQGAAARYRNPVWTNRVGLVDWQELNREAANDLNIARRAKPDSQKTRP